MKEKKNQYNKQYSNFQYRSRDISLFLLITRIFGRKREQRTCSERFTRSSRIINRSGRGGSRRYDLSRRTQNHGSYSKVYPSPYTAREMIGEGSGASFACREREQAATRYRLSINTLVTRTRRNTIGFSNGGRAPSTTDRCN